MNLLCTGSSHDPKESAFAGHYIGIYLMALILTFSGCSSPNVSDEELKAPPGAGWNVALILVDTLRPDHLGAHGYSRPTSPFIDSLASEGVLFENARSASTYTGEAVSSLFTGRPPVMSATGLGWSARPTPMESNMPKLFEAAGYRTGIFSTSFVMRFKGFYNSFQDAELFPGVANTSALDGNLTDAALAHAARYQGERTFQYLHFYAPHAPYNPPAEYLDRFTPDGRILEADDEIHPASLVAQGMQRDDPRLAEFQKHYDAEIALIDACIERYIAGLREQGTLSKTLVIIVSDHGEEFMEHGFADHAWTLFDETLRIPLIFWAPSLLPPARVTERVSIVDIMPTLLRCLQIPHTPFTEPVAGQYLFTAGDSGWEFGGRQGAIYASLFPETRAQLHAVLFDHYKYIAGPRWLEGAELTRFWMLQGTLAERARAQNFLPFNPWAPPEMEAIYDLENDPDETRNLAGEHPDLVKRGRALLETYKKAAAPYRTDAPATTEADPFSDALIAEQMRQLLEKANLPSGSGASTEERIDPEVIEGLETMGYL